MKDEFEDRKIQEYIKSDNIISKKANDTFDQCINEIKNSQESIENTRNEIHHMNGLKKFLSVAASIVIVLIGANVYASTQGYENIFFMIKEIYTSTIVSNKDEIFSDREIVISYKSFYVTENIEMQVNELQVKNNEAKLFLYVKENDENKIEKLKYKVYNIDNKQMCNIDSSKLVGQKNYNEELALKNYDDKTNIIILKIYNNSSDLIKTVTINLEEKTIEARSENEEVKKISQIKLNEFLKEQTKVSEKENVLILKLTDIEYSGSTYIVTYLYSTPTDEEIKNGDVENLPIHEKTVKFIVSGENFKEI